MGARPSPHGIGRHGRECLGPRPSAPQGGGPCGLGPLVSPGRAQGAGHATPAGEWAESARGLCQPAGVLRDLPWPEPRGLRRVLPSGRALAALSVPDGRDWVPEDDVAHSGATAVEQVPLGAVAVLPIPGGKAECRPPPMLALLISACVHGIIASRRSGRATHGDLGVRQGAVRPNPNAPRQDSRGSGSARPWAEACAPPDPGAMARTPRGAGPGPTFMARKNSIWPPMETGHTSSALESAPRPHVQAIGMPGGGWQRVPCEPVPERR